MAKTTAGKRIELSQRDVYTIGRYSLQLWVFLFPKVSEDKLGNDIWEISEFHEQENNNKSFSSANL